MQQSSGLRAEESAARYLEKHGHTIIARNWRRPYAEIDIITQDRNNCIQFVEVKYRTTDYAGDGLDYITATKLKQMRRAAIGWLQENNSQDSEVILSVIAISGKDYVVTDYLEDVS